jgi:hypothetical protein
MSKAFFLAVCLGCGHSGTIYHDADSELEKLEISANVSNFPMLLCAKLHFGICGAQFGLGKVQNVIGSHIRCASGNPAFIRLTEGSMTKL